MLKRIHIESAAIRRAAQGEACTLEIVGVCNGRTDTTVLAHLPDESHGLSRKADDLSACFGCHACHDVVDGRRAWPAGEERHAEWYKRRAQVRTLRRLVERGIVNIKGITL